VKNFVNSIRSPKRNVGGIFHFGCAWGQQVRGNNIARGEGGLKNITCDSSRTACAVAVLQAMCTGFPNAYSVNGVGS